jgi:crossover junction endodeoxyribonuclease RuvC
MQYVIGIDPGLNGAVAILDAKTGALIEVWSMPVVELKVGKSIKRKVSPEVLASELRTWSDATAVIEQVASSPQMGVTSAFGFGESYGVVRGVLAGMSIPCHTVVPAKWKRDMGLNSSKDGSRAKAIQLWPGQAGEFKLVKDADKAEAALIAHWRIAKGTM